MLFICDKCKEICHSLSICSCDSPEDRESHASSSFNEDRPILVEIENKGSSKGEESTSRGENKGITESDEERTTLRHVEDSMDTKMGLDIYGNSARTSDSEEKYLDERTFFRNKLISSLKEIKDLSKKISSERSN